MTPLDPPLVAFLEAYEKALAAQSEPTLAEIRQAYAGGYLAGSPATDTAIETQDIALPTGASMRLYLPPEQLSDALILYFHGGGFSLGSVAAYDAQSRWLAEKTGQRVVSVDYRLAPEHPFPAAPDDARAAWQAVQARGLASSDQIILAGDSAGGALSLVTAVEACAQGKPPRKIVALYPATDMSRPQDLAEASGSLVEFATGHYLSTEEMIWFRMQYLPQPSDATDWRASVVFAEGLEKLPETIVVSARRDPLFDQAAAFHARISEKGVEATHVVFEAVLHNFMEHYQISEASREAASAVVKALCDHRSPVAS